MVMAPDIRIGSGYDVHSFLETTAAQNTANYITLCGVKIPFPKILNGHSDSDVALHALTDALLGTYNLGDIGKYFPPEDPQWKNANSQIFVNKALELITQHNGKISNIDITIIAEKPKIQPYNSQMCKNLAQMLELELNRVSVKATTNEKIGFIGRGEGIAALASCCVIFY